MPRLRAFRWLIWLVVLVAIAAAAVFLWKRQRPAEAAPYRTESVSRGDITMTVTATGTLSAVTTVKVGSQVSGIISRLHADFNSRVQEGQLLVELDPTPFEAQVEQRRADLAQAEAQMRNTEVVYQRQNRLLAEGLTSPSDYDAAKASYEQAVARVEQTKAALTQAETNLQYTMITSPISGVVVDRQYDVGQTVAASFQAPTLFTIAQDLTRMQVQADVDQSDIGRLEIGQQAHFTVDAYPEREFHGKITQIRLNATVSQNVITYPVIIEVANPGEKLRPNMTADVSIDVATVQNVLRVPNAALRFRPPESAIAAAKPAAAASNGQSPSPPRAGAVAAPTAERGGFPRPGAADGRPFGGRRPRERKEQTIYLLDAGATLKPVTVRTGITDGRFTEVVAGEIEEGAPVVVGTPTVKTEETRRPPGMGRF